MKNLNLFLFLLLIIINVSCRNLDKEISIAKQKNKIADSLYQKKNIEYDERLKLFENCLKKIELAKNPQENTVQKEENKKLIESLGLWNTPSIYGGGVLELTKENNNYYKIEIFPDGSKSRLKMDITIKGRNKIFKLSDRNSNDRWIVYPNGKLEVVDRDGIIYSENKLF